MNLQFIIMTINENGLHCHCIHAHNIWQKRNTNNRQYVLYFLKNVPFYFSNKHQTYPKWFIQIAYVVTIHMITLFTACDIQSLLNLKKHFIIVSHCLLFYLSWLIFIIFHLVLLIHCYDSDKMRNFVRYVSPVLFWHWKEITLIAIHILHENSLLLSGRRKYRMMYEC